LYPAQQRKQLLGREIGEGRGFKINAIKQTSSVSIPLQTKKKVKNHFDPSCTTLVLFLFFKMLKRDQTDSGDGIEWLDRTPIISRSVPTSESRILV
tara:strand:+ start:310 stop:597 length:288 start_codon:yes stop_codon:yes gene_type:complete